MSSEATQAALSGWPHDSSPYHAGEQAVQERIGVRERAERAGRRIIRDFMPEQHRRFFSEMPFVVIGSVDHESRLWGSILVGRPGFMHSPEPRVLTISARPCVGDPLNASLRVGAELGLLGIQFETRRRNRMNGTVTAVTEAAFDVTVRQSFGNCPQYIQARAPHFVADPDIAREIGAHAEGPVLSQAAAGLVRRADTFFIATASVTAGKASPADGADISHRGGRPGFVRVDEEGGRSVLVSPDFVGNFVFNTLGNLAINPRAGILFVDFQSGDVLSLTGHADVIWDGPEVQAFAGAQRLLRFRLDSGIWMKNALPLRWSAPEPAPQLARTGRW